MRALAQAAAEESRVRAERAMELARAGSAAAAAAASEKASARAPR